MTVLLSTIGAVYFITLLNTLNIAINPILFYIFIALFTIMGLFAIFKKDLVSEIVTKSYYVIISILMSWNFSAFDIYPTFTFLFMLSIYDIFAVLSPCGPLNKLIQSMKIKKKPLTGLFFEVTVDDTKHGKGKEAVKDIELASTSEVGYHPVPQEDSDLSSHSTTNITDEDSSIASSTNNSNSNVDTKLRKIQLGLGDLVFYSVLTDQALTSPKGGIIAFICCSITILFGLLYTIHLLTKHRQPLPALPIGIIGGIIMYFLVTSVI